jgi:hypothetical protein
MRTGVLVVLSVLGCCWLCAADGFKPLDVKLGLWETTNTFQMSGMPQINLPPDALARMTPEQRAQVEQMMKGNARTTTTKSCMTREKMNRSEMFGADRKECTRTVVSSSGNKMEVRMACTTDGGKMTGTFRVEAANSETVKGSMQMTSTGSDHTMNMNSNFTSRWLGADCGDVK